MELVRELERGRLIDKSDSLDAQILSVLDSLRGQVEKGILPVKTINDTFNEGKPEKFQTTYQRMGRKLAALGFKKGKTGDGASAILWDEDKFMRIFSAYGLGETSETPETSEIPENAPAEEPDVSDNSDDSDVCSGAYGHKKLHSFLRTARNALPGKVLHLWNLERQRQAAAKVRQGPALSDDIFSGEEVEL
jgi:hypothetical protein